jgi:hypothetical protein
VLKFLPKKKSLFLSVLTVCFRWAMHESAGRCVVARLHAPVLFLPTWVMDEESATLRAIYRVARWNGTAIWWTFVSARAPSRASVSAEIHARDASAAKRRQSRHKLGTALLRRRPSESEWTDRRYPNYLPQLDRSCLHIGRRQGDWTMNAGFACSYTYTCVRQQAIISPSPHQTRG